MLQMPLINRLKCEYKPLILYNTFLDWTQDYKYITEGVASGEGNQGVETGSPGARNYGPGGGIGDGGPSYRLGDRRVQSLPLPRYDNLSEGIIVVEISVDREGNVTKAVAGVKGSTTLDEYLLMESSDAAMKAKFDSNDSAPLLQKGTITYNFKLR